MRTRGIFPIILVCLLVVLVGWSGMSYAAQTDDASADTETKVELDEVEGTLNTWLGYLDNFRTEAETWSKQKLAEKKQTLDKRRSARESAETTTTTTPDESTTDNDTTDAANDGVPTDYVEHTSSVLQKITDILKQLPLGLLVTILALELLVFVVSIPAVFYVIVFIIAFNLVRGILRFIF